MESKHNAQFLRRLLARIIDFNLITFTIALIYFIISGSFSIGWRESLAWDLVYTLYLVITPLIWTGYIIGKRICNIKIKQTNGAEVTFSNTFKREVIGFHLIGILTLGIPWIASVFMIIFRHDRRAVHDMIGDTYVKKTIA